MGKLIPGVVSSISAGGGGGFSSPQVVDWSALTSMPAGWTVAYSETGAFDGGYRPNPDTDLTGAAAEFALAKSYTSASLFTLVCAIETSITSTTGSSYARLALTDLDYGDNAYLVSITSDTVTAGLLNYVTPTRHNATSSTVAPSGPQIVVMALRWNGTDLVGTQYAADGTILTTTTTPGEGTDAFTSAAIQIVVRNFNSQHAKILGTVVIDDASVSDATLLGYANTFGWVASGGGGGTPAVAHANDWRDYLKTGWTETTDGGATATFTSAGMSESVSTNYILNDYLSTGTTAGLTIMAHVDVVTVGSVFAYTASILCSGTNSSVTIDNVGISALGQGTAPTSISHTTAGVVGIAMTLATDGTITVYMVDADLVATSMSTTSLYVTDTLTEYSTYLYDETPSGLVVVNTNFDPNHALSESAIIDIFAGWFPATNDNFANIITFNPTTAGTLSGTTTASTLETGEPTVTGFETSPTVWYKFVANATGNITIDMIGSETAFATDSALAIYSGTNFGDMVLLANNDDFSGTDPQIVQAVTNGTTYFVQVIGLGLGQFYLNWSTIV